MVISLFSLLVLTSSISLILLQNLNPVTNVLAQKEGEGESNPVDSEMKKKLEQKMLEIFGNQTSGQDQDEHSTPSSSLGDESMLDSLINQKQQDDKAKKNQKQFLSSPSSALKEKDSMLDNLINQKILDNKAKNEKKLITFGKSSQQQKSTYDNVIVNFSKSSTTDYKFGIFLADGGQVSATLNIKPDVTYSTTAQDIEFAKATGGKEILNFKKEAEIDNGIFKAHLSYFIPYSKLPDDIVSSLSSKEQTATTVNPSSFAKGQMRASTIVSTTFGGIALILSLEVLDNFLDSHSQISTTTDYVKRIEKLSAIKKCIENPILPYADPHDKVKLLEMFEKTVSWVKFDAIASFVYGVGQGAAIPPVLSIVFNPLFDAEAAVFDKDADNEIATMSKAVGNCKKGEPNWKGTFNVNLEPQAPRIWPFQPVDVIKQMTGDFSFKILLNDCKNNECKIEGTGNVRAQISTLETKHEWDNGGFDYCTEPNLSSALKIIVLGTYIPSSNMINLKMHANFINSPPIPIVEIDCFLHSGYKYPDTIEEQIDIYQFWYGGVDGLSLGSDDQAEIYQLTAINGFTLSGDIKMSPGLYNTGPGPPHFNGHYKITIFPYD